MECLAVVKAVDHFAIHVLGRNFAVVTNHRALARPDLGHTPNEVGIGTLDI